MQLSTGVIELVRDALDETYEDMAFGSEYMRLISLMNQGSNVGAAVEVPLKQDRGAGSSADAPTAYANATLATRKKFLVPYYKCYGFSNIPLDQDNLTRNENAVAALLLDESKTAMENAQAQMDVALGGIGYGELNFSGNGTCTNTSGSTWTIALSTLSEALRFREKQVLVQKTNLTDGTLNAGTATVQAIDVSAKLLTITANGGFTPVAARFLGEQGTMIASASPSIWPGILGIIPPAGSRPVGGESFCGIDRSKSPLKLAGAYLDGTQMSILEGTNQLDHMIANVPGSKVDTLVCSYQTRGKLVSAIQAKRLYVEERSIPNAYNINVPVTTINGAKGDIDIVASSNWPDTYISLLTRKSWKAEGRNGKMFQPATSNGVPIVEVPGDDVAVAKYRGQAFIYTTAPGHNGTLTITP